MKKIFILSMALFYFANAFTQLNPQHLANADLRAIFQNLNLPSPNTRHFLYDMSAHVVDEDFFSNMCPKQNNTDNWFMLYEEMYYAAYDTLLWNTADDIFDDVYNNGGGIVPIGIMDFDYYRLKDDALTTPLYFDFDIANNKLIDKVGRPADPYDTYNVFSAAPLIHSSYFSDVTFSVKKYLDQFNTQYYGLPYSLKINFDDGMGWINFPNPQNTTYTANYTVMGDKNIEVAIIDDGNRMIKYSHSLFKVGTTHTSPTPDMVINSVPGLTAEAYLIVKTRLDN